MRASSGPRQRDAPHAVPRVSGRVPTGLSPSASTLLRRMSVFAAPATPTMLGELLLGSGSTGSTGSAGNTDHGRAVEVVMSELLDRGLVIGSSGAGEPAFSLLDAVRVLAADLLVEAGEVGVAEHAHTRAVMALAGSRSAPELARSEPDLRQVLRRLTGRAEVSDGLRLACSLVPFVLRRGYDGLVGAALASLLQQACDTGVDDVLLARARQGSAALAEHTDRSATGWVDVPVPAQARRDAELTRREWDVLDQLTTGATNKEIAARLEMAPKTVMHHSVAIYRKLGVRGRAEATAWAFRHGVVS